MSEILQGLASGQQAGSAAVSNANQSSNNAAQWAYQSAEVGLKRDHLKIAQEQHEQAKTEFGITVNTQMADEYLALTREPDKKMRMAGFNNYKRKWEQAGKTIDSSYGDALQGEVAFPAVQELARVYGASDKTSTQFKNWVQSLDKSFGITFATNQAIAAAKGLETLNAAKYKADASVVVGGAKIGQQAGKAFETATAPTTKQIDQGILLLDQLAKVDQEGGFKSDEAFKKMIAIGMVKMETGSNRPAAEIVNSIAYKNAIGFVNKKVSDVTGDPSAQMTPAQRKQASGMLHTMIGGYVNNFESKIGSLQGGNDFANNEIASRAQNARDMYRSRLAKHNVDYDAITKDGGSVQQPELIAELSVGEQKKQAMVVRAKSDRDKINAQTNPALKAAMEAKYKSAYSEDIRKSVEGKK